RVEQGGRRLGEVGGGVEGKGGRGPLRAQHVREASLPGTKAAGRGQRGAARQAAGVLPGEGLHPEGDAGRGTLQQRVHQVGCNRAGGQYQQRLGITLLRRPRVSGDPYSRGRWLWVPAFAGTTAIRRIRRIPVRWSSTFELFLISVRSLPTVF